MPPGNTMTPFEHWVVKVALAFNTALRAAKELDPATMTPGRRSPGEAEVSRLAVKAYDMLHEAKKLAREQGMDEFFGPP